MVSIGSLDGGARAKGEIVWIRGTAEVVFTEAVSRLDWRFGNGACGGNNMIVRMLAGLLAMFTLMAGVARGGVGGEMGGGFGEVCGADEGCFDCVWEWAGFIDGFAQAVGAGVFDSAG